MASSNSSNPTITYLLELDPTGAFKAIDKVSKAFNELQGDQKKLAENFNKAGSSAALEAHINKLKELRQGLKANSKEFAELQSLGLAVVNKSGAFNPKATLAKLQAQINTAAKALDLVRVNAEFDAWYTKTVNQLKALQTMQQATAATAASAAKAKQEILNAQTAYLATVDTSVIQTLLQSMAKVVAEVKKLSTGMWEFRNGITSADMAMLKMARTIKSELANKAKLQVELAGVSPNLRNLVETRTKGSALQERLESVKAEAALAVKEGARYTVLQDILVKYKEIKVQLEANYEVQRRLTAEVEKELALQKGALNRLGYKATSFQREGIFANLNARGVSAQAIEAEKYRHKLEDINAIYAKLQARTKERISGVTDKQVLAQELKTFENIAAKLGIARDKYQALLGAMEKATQGVSRLDQAHKPFLERIFDLVVGYRLVNSAVNTFTNALRSIPQTGLEFETTYATMKAVFSVTETVNSELRMLDTLAEEAGLSITTLRESFSQFAASAKFSGESLENINEIFANLSKAGAVLHLPADKMKSAFTAINQMYGKNQVMMEELKRQLGNQLPAAVNIFALSMGKTTRQLMDDMKKGLVMPKETLLQFSRTYARIFADPESMAYASSGVNAHIQRLSTAWTNFSQKIYEESKGGIKGGLAIATGAVQLLTENMEVLKDVTLTLGIVLGVAFVGHLGKALAALELYKKAAIVAAAANASFLAHRASTAAANVGAAAVGTWSALANLFAKIPKWTLGVGGIALAALSLKDVEVATASVTSEFDKLTKTTVPVTASITIGDVALQSWKDLVDYMTDANLEANKLKAKTPGERHVTQAFSFWGMAGNPFDMIADGYAKLANLTPMADRANANKQRQLRDELAAKENEKLTEKVKETMLSSVGDTVDETMTGTTKRVTAALQRIEAEFDRLKGIVNRDTDLAVTKLQSDITKLTNQEKLGKLDSVTSKQKALEIQRKIFELQDKAATKELKLLEDKLKNTIAISKRQLDTSKEANRLLLTESKLTLSENFASIMKEAGVYKTGYPTSKEKEKFLEIGSPENITIEAALAKYKQENPEDKSFENKSLQELVTSKGLMEEQVKNVKQARADFTKLQNKQADYLAIIASGQTNQTEALTKFLGEVADKGAFGNEDIVGITQTAKLKDEYAAMLARITAQYKVPFALATAIMKNESAFDPNATSSAGAVGLMQLMPGTAKDMGVTNRRDPEQSMTGGVKYLSILLKEFNNDIDKTIAAYNTGANNVKKLGLATVLSPTYSHGTGETGKYLTKVKADYERFSELGSFMPTAAEFKANIVKSTEETAQTANQLLEAQAQQAIKRITDADTLSTNQVDITVSTLTKQRNVLQKQLELISSERETALAMLEQTVIPLEDSEKLKKTYDINKSFQAKITQAIDAEIGFIKERLKAGIGQEDALQLRQDLASLEQKKTQLTTDIAKQAFEVRLNNVIPMETKLQQMQRELTSSLNEQLGIFDEELYKKQFLIDKTEVLKEIELQRSKGNTAVADAMQKQVDKLKQVQLLQEKIAKSQELSDSFQSMKQSDLALTKGSYFGGADGEFATAWFAQENARSTKSQELGFKQNTLKLQTEELARLKAEGNEGTAAWYKQTNAIKQTKLAMLDLKTATNEFTITTLNKSFDMIGEAFLSWTNGAKSAKDAFKDLAIGFASMIQQMLMEVLKAVVIKAAMGFLTGGIGSAGGGGGSLTGGTSGLGGGGNFLKFATGGSVLRSSKSGVIKGAGTGTSDSNLMYAPLGSFILNANATAKAKNNKLIRVSNGETFLSPSDVKNIGLANLEKLNAQGFAKGGMVTNSSSNTIQGGSSSGGNIINISVTVPEGTSNGKQFGKDVGMEIVKVIAKQEAAMQINLYDKQQRKRRA